MTWIFCWASASPAKSLSFQLTSCLPSFHAVHFWLFLFKWVQTLNLALQNLTLKHMTWLSTCALLQDQPISTPIKPKQLCFSALFIHFGNTLTHSGLYFHNRRGALSSKVKDALTDWQTVPNSQSVDSDHVLFQTTSLRFLQVQSENDLKNYEFVF